MGCKKCVNGVIYDGSNGLPCNCESGKKAIFNIDGKEKPVTGEELIKELNIGYTAAMGDYLVVQVPGDEASYIAEVIEKDPLVVKIEEDGAYSHLKEGQFLVRKRYTRIMQKDCREGTNIILEIFDAKTIGIATGLKSLGIEGNKILLVHAPIPTE